MDRGIALKTEPDGRMFPITDLSSTIVDCLENEARSKGIVVHTQKEVVNLWPADSGHWQVQFKDDGEMGLAKGDEDWVKITPKVSKK